MTLHNVINGIACRFRFLVRFLDRAPCIRAMVITQRPAHAPARSMSLRYFLERGCSCRRMTLVSGGKERQIALAIVVRVAAAGNAQRPRYVSHRHDLHRRTVRRHRVVTRGTRIAGVTGVTADGGTDSVIDRLCDVLAEVGTPPQTASSSSSFKVRTSKAFCVGFRGLLVCVMASLHGRL